MNSSPRADFSICVVLSGNQQTGGGYHQALSNLRRILSAVPKEFSISVLDAKGTFRDGINNLIAEGQLRSGQVITLPQILPSLVDRVVADRRLPYRLIRRSLGFLGKSVGVSPLARFLDISAYDLIIFASPCPEAGELTLKPYVWTLWDLCHLDSPEFPEVRTSGKFEARENFNSLAIRKAALVIADSADLVAKAQLYFGARPEKFITIPFQPPVLISTGTHYADLLPARIQNISGQYFFYPAQLWTHKNHLRIVEALYLLKTQGLEYHAVFIGKDHGAGNRIRKQVALAEMENNIHFLGYVEDDVIPALYSNAIALVMASYFGPTNIPPLEALALKVPVIASNIHLNQLGNAALYFDPDSASELAAQMKAVAVPETKSKLVAAGTRRLLEIDSASSIGLGQLTDALERLSKRLIR